MKIHEIACPPPVEALIERFGRRHMPFILDSAQTNDDLGGWSFFGAYPFEIIRGDPDSDADLGMLRRKMQSYACNSHPRIPFIGGAVGFLAYDYGRRLEKVPEIAVNDRNLPDLHFAIYDGIAALNNQTGVLYLIALGIRGEMDQVLEGLKAIVWTEPSPAATEPRPAAATPASSDWEWNLSTEDYCSAVRRVREYIASGDVYQVNLSRRARCRFQGDTIALYCALRRGNPAPYGAYLDLGDLQFFSTSPEQFLQKRSRNLVTRPIKGTRPRGQSAVEQKHQAQALRQSAKDRAELLMIVDLERNDLGRVAKYGSVRVEALYQLESYARVIHQTAQVQARLAKGKDVYDALHALFPGGSITGAPKVRAMEIIEELEPTRRGVYCGSVGYIGFDGDAEFNIAIRSLHLKDGFLDYQVGGGIVWDSDPESEFQETLDKGRAIQQAVDTLCRKL
ncbi:MAG: aminodeoxychorismate synthase component I [Halieaceae bacterium]|nr:aminodeoxychorismate synthase component I [Halieaceae bacterium]